MFQSSPSPKAGSYKKKGKRRNYNGKVSILSQPEGRELHAVLDRYNRDLYVSILSQPEGRELQFIPYPATWLNAFQSSPSPKAGSYATG